MYMFLETAFRRKQLSISIRHDGENAALFEVLYENGSSLKAMVCCLLPETVRTFYLRDMDDDTFSAISREYYEILHDIDNLCQTMGTQGKNKTNTQMPLDPDRHIGLIHCHYPTYLL